MITSNQTLAALIAAPRHVNPAVELWLDLWQKGPLSAEELIHLKGRRVPRVDQACQNLYDLRSSIGVFRLYKQFFPREYSKSQAPLFIEHVDSFNTRELEFFRLVNERLFPILEDVLDEWGQDSERDATIPFTPMGLDWMDSLCEWTLPVQVFALMMMGDALDEDQLAEIGPGTPQLTAFDGRLYAIDWRRFTRLCRQAGGLMALVPTALDVAGHSTGNLWLDVTYETLDAVQVREWTPENVQYLARQWRKAKKLLDRTNQVLEWLEADPRPLAHIIEFWNQSIVPRRKKREHEH